MNLLMLSCKKSSELIEKKMLFNLNPIEKIQLFLHTSMCDACKKWEKQSKDMDSTLHKHLNANGLTKETDLPNSGLSDEAKQKIIEKLGLDE